MKVFDLLENIDLNKKDVVQEEVLDHTSNNDVWAKKYFSAPSFTSFMKHYKAESQELVRTYNTFIREFADNKLPNSAAKTITEMKQYLKFAQSLYRHPQLSEGVNELSENVKYAIRKSWGDYPSYFTFFEEMTKDMRRLYKK
jgi:hypothetical protein